MENTENKNILPYQTCFKCSSVLENKKQFSRTLSKQAHGTWNFSLNRGLLPFFHFPCSHTATSKTHPTAFSHSPLLPFFFFCSHLFFLLLLFIFFPFFLFWFSKNQSPFTIANRTIDKSSSMAWCRHHFQQPPFSSLTFSPHPFSLFIIHFILFSFFIFFLSFSLQLHCWPAATD